MAISLADIRRNVIGPPRTVLYGVPGIGKTTLAACARKPIFITAEDGLGTLDVPTFPKANSYTDVIDAIGALLTQEHEFETVVLDSLDAVEPMIHRTVSARAGKDNIEGFGYGKGYTVAAAEMRNLLDGFDALRARGMAVILIAHSSVVHFEDPERDGYDRYQMRLDKRADAVVSDWADAILFLNYEVAAINKADGETKRGAGTGQRVIHTCERPAFKAKNRYRMPPAIKIPEDQPGVAWAAIENAIAASAKPAAVAS